MNAHGISNGVKTTRVMNAVAAGTTDQNSSSVDMQNFEGVEFTALLGALTATQVTQMKLQQSSDDGSSDGWSDIEGSQSTAMADDDDNQCIVVDIYKPTKRYVRAVLERGTANAVIDGIVAKQYNARKQPVTNDATTVQDTVKLVEPAEGTA